MPTYVSFTSLTADITAYIERGSSASTDPTVNAQIPRLINAAERRICNALKLLGEKEILVSAAGLVAGSNVVTKPDRWRATVSMSYGTGANQNSRTSLYPRDYGYCRAYWSDDSLTSPPKFYADYGLLNWLVVPTPDLTYPLESVCYMQPTLLDSGNQTNFFTNYTPNLLLYASLLEATPFLKNDERIPVWMKFYDDELAVLLRQDLQRIMDQSAQRVTV